MTLDTIQDASTWAYHDADRRLNDTRSLTDSISGAFPGDVTGVTGWHSGMVWAGYAPDGPVTAASAMQISAVFACLRLLSEAIATLPLDTFRRSGGTRFPFRPRPDYLSFDPPQGSRIEFLSQVMLSLLVDGNAFVATPRDNFGVPTDLVVIDPTRVGVRRLNGRVVFDVGGDTYPDWLVMHIKGMCLPGELRGVSPIAAARHQITWGRAAQEYGQAVMTNRAVPPAVIELPSVGNDSKAEQSRAERVAATWQATHGGQGNAGKVGVLIGGAKLSTVAITPEDAQWLEAKQFGVSEIARFFGVPPHLIADASNSTSWGSGLAEQNLAFGQFALRPWTERIEEALGRLLTSHGLPEVFVRLNSDALLRASLADRYASYATGIGSQFLTINEARALEDLPPVSWGDTPVTASGGAP